MVVVVVLPCFSKGWRGLDELFVSVAALSERSYAMSCRYMVLKRIRSSVI